MPRRGNSEGSIYHMQDGRWRGAVSIGKDANGKPINEIIDEGVSDKRLVVQLLFCNLAEGGSSS
jgi:hypothetical protein